MSCEGEPGRHFDNGDAVDRAMRRGAERAVRRHRRLGAALLYSEDGKIVERDPWSVKLPMVDPSALLPPPEDTHSCDQLEAILDRYDGLCREWGEDGRGSDGPLLWGKAVKRIEKRRGRWFAHNGEYALPVSYCPACGERLT